MSQREPKKDCIFPLATLGMGFALGAISYSKEENTLGIALGGLISSVGLGLILHDCKTLEDIFEGTGNGIRANLYGFKKDVLKQRELNSDSLYFSYLH